ncbi:MAG: 16S rRNA (cytosine(1402)-N(4))-methyltransferase RsmH [bacterium]|nr:16S rRNA (cytosine(1402)-N(4))-methyltransferase RsmH [bacterium]MDZ4342313.1 16S rRNA (cytosine(1402)-N(4))-methyltransferase RsmH [Candidatus Binatia bacterium]
MPASDIHVPVLLHEVLSIFSPRSGQRLLDATMGHGGHAAAYLSQTAPDGFVTGFDADANALTVANNNLSSYKHRFELIHANFANLKNSLTGGGIVERGSTFTNNPPNKIAGFHYVLFDLGVGTHQLSDADRGFSFTAASNLNMRYGAADDLPDAKLSSLNDLRRRLGHLPDAVDILSHLDEISLVEIFRYYGEERYARRIARAIKAADTMPATGVHLAEVIAKAVPAAYRHGRINPATRVFQALRLAVNRELEALQAALPQALDLLLPEGIVAVISFHSLEDRIVKQTFRDWAKTCICPPQQPECTCEHKPSVEVITKKPITASAEEINKNPRSRSAKLRAARKLPP